MLYSADSCEHKFDTWVFCLLLLSSEKGLLLASLLSSCSFWGAEALGISFSTAPASFNQTFCSSRLSFGHRVFSLVWNQGEKKRRRRTCGHVLSRNPCVKLWTSFWPRFRPRFGTAQKVLESIKENPICRTKEQIVDKPVSLPSAQLGTASGCLMRQCFLSCSYELLLFMWLREQVVQPCSYSTASVFIAWHTFKLRKMLLSNHCQNQNLLWALISSLFVCANESVSCKWIFVCILQCPK